MSNSVVYFMQFHAPSHIILQHLDRALPTPNYPPKHRHNNRDAVNYAHCAHMHILSRRRHPPPPIHSTDADATRNWGCTSRYNASAMQGCTWGYNALRCIWGSSIPLLRHTLCHSCARRVFLFAAILFDKLWYSLILFNTLWYDLILFDMIWYSLIWFYTLWYYLIVFDTLWHYVIILDSLLQ